MNKALEILKDIRTDSCFDKYMNITDEEIALYFDEAIAELEAIKLTRREWYQKGFNEAMKTKTCEGCRYGRFGIDSFGLEIECTLAYRCSRGQDDMFKPKDNA